MKHEIDKGAERITNIFNGDQPFFIGRNGSTEIMVYNYWIKYRSSNIPWKEEMLARLENNFGIWPITSDSLDEWCKEYNNAFRQLNGLAAGWYKPLAEIEYRIIKEIVPTAFTFPLRSLEPYYVTPDLRWTATLADKDVAVVTSFTETIQEQLDRIDPLKIWSELDEPDTILPPTARWHLVKTYFPPNVAGNHCTGWASKGITSWLPAVEYIVKEVLKTGAKYAIVGCGAIGMVVAGKLRERGVSVILLGGAVQVLFGIRGKRWAQHDIISKFWNAAWTSPLKSECPPNAETIEGGCYW